MKPYPKYRDSGVEWLGDFPAHWNVKLLKRVCALTYGDALPDDYRNDGQIPVYGSNGIVGRHDENNTLAPSIIVGRKGSYGKLNYSLDEAFAIDTTYFIDAKTTKYNIRWLYYALLCLRLDEGSKDSAVPGLAREDAYKHSLPDCNILEQHAIAAFLDRETARIDSLIQKKERMIELLKEKRIALITQTVTKGLDPIVPMKDSGIEWLGEVPEHWGKKRIKDLLLPKKGAIKTGPFGSQLLSSEMDDSDVKVYNQKSVITKDFESGENYISFKKLETLKEFQTYPGDFLITTRGTIGRCAILPPDSETGILHPCLMRLQTNKEIVDDRFLELLIEESQVVIEQLKLKSNGTTIEVIYQDSLKNVTVFLPPIHEQLSIAAYLDMKTNKTDLLIYQIETSISLLREYRASLIHHAVTGKIDLRGYDAQAQ